MLTFDTTMPDHVLRVAKALYEAESTIYDFRIAWDDIGPYRRFCYKLKAEAALGAMHDSRPVSLM